MADPKRATMVERIGYFATIPLNFINDAEVSDRAHRLYVILRSYTSPDKPDWVFPGYETIRVRCGWSNYRYVASALRELETRGWITRQKRYGQSTRYNLNASPVLPTGVGLDICTSPTNGCSTVLPTGVGTVLHPLVEEQEPKNKNQKKQDAAAAIQNFDALAVAAKMDKMPSAKIVKGNAKKAAAPSPFDLGDLENAPAIRAHRRVCGNRPMTVEQATFIVSQVNGTAETTWPIDLLKWTKGIRKSDGEPYRLDAYDKQVQFHMDAEVRRRNGAGPTTGPVVSDDVYAAIRAKIEATI